MAVSPPDTRVWWFNRRIHAYMSMVGLYGLVIVALTASPEQLEAASPLLIALAWIFGMVLFLYGGSATAEDIVKLRAYKP